MAALMVVLLPAQAAINPTFGALAAGALGICLAVVYLAERPAAIRNRVVRTAWRPGASRQHAS
jgi:hypothetical protein